MLRPAMLKDPDGIVHYLHRGHIATPICYYKSDRTIVWPVNQVKPTTDLVTCIFCMAFSDFATFTS